MASSTADFHRVVLGKKLGSGSFGTVYVGLLPNGRFVAVKMLELEEPSTSSSTNVEVDIHRRLSHPNIIRYLYSYEDMERKSLLVFLEFVTGGSVSSLMQSLPGGKLPVNVARVYARHMFEGLEYLHRNQVAHRDIKGDNLLISMDTGLAKLADFDQAKSIAACSCKLPTTKTLAGTPYFIAPEVITNDTGYDPFKADVWSAGCTVAEMITGRLPWTASSNIMQIMNKIAMTNGWPDAIPRDAQTLGCEEAVTFLDLCFCRDANARPSTSELLMHPFLANV
jgi:serine/threonine protein kinase